MQGGLFLDVVVGERAVVLQLVVGEKQSLLIGRDAFLVLDLGLHVLDGVGRFDIERDGLSGQGFDEDLHRLERHRKQAEEKDQANHARRCRRPSDFGKRGNAP